MKKRLVTLMMALCLAFALAVPAGAASMEQTPEELYQEYLKVATKINEEYGTDISVIPLQEMDTADMPTVEKVASDVRNLAEMKKSMEPMETAAENMPSVSVMSNPDGGEPGTYYVSVNIGGTWGDAGFIFKASGNFTITTPTGSKNFYFQGASGAKIESTRVPSGYTLTANGATQISLSSNKRTYVLTRSYTVKRNSASATFTPVANFVVNATSGMITGTSRGA